MEDEFHWGKDQFGRCKRIGDINSRDEENETILVEINRIFWPTGCAFRCQIKIV